MLLGQMLPGQMLPGQMSPGQMSPGQMSPGQMSPGQMSPGQISGEQLESVLDVLWNLRLKVWSKFGSVTAKILLTLSLCGGCDCGGCCVNLFYCSS